MTTKKHFEVISEGLVQCNLISTNTTNAENLLDICESINKTIQKLSAGYIWHRDEFRVHVPILRLQNCDDCPSKLISSTCFGDNIEDEWFIVYLILEITKQYQDLVIQIFDNDGEFLLIESADFLPPWANPDSTANRVFIYQNCIHLIPPSIVDLETDITLEDAIKIVIENSEQTASPDIYQAILNRICGYPEKINENVHNAIVRLPIHIAALLKLKPSLISNLTTAYCNHDVVEAKICKDVKFEDCIITQVKFTKCLYAMLIHSKLSKNAKHVRVKENDKKSSLGLKLTCGYEMIMGKLTGDVFSSREFNNFIKNLTKHGYFNGNLEGSNDYKHLLTNAKEFFLNMESPINLQNCNTIMQLINSQEFTNIKEKLHHEQCSTESLSEDNDDWLNVNPDELNDLLNSRYGKNPKFTKNEISSENIQTELSNFLKQTSDFEGIETQDAEGDESGEENIEFDSEQFINSLKNIMNIVSGHNNDVDIDSDDFSDMENITEEEEFDLELKAKLSTDETQGQHSMYNIIQSIKEEEGSSGPSSNILKTIGINKTDLL